jgi:transposase InsO family protein
MLPAPRPSGAVAGGRRAGRTVNRVLRRWIEEGVEGLSDRRRGRPKGVAKVDLRAMAAIRRPQQNPGLGEFRVHAALALEGIHLSPRTCGRMMALHRELYGLGKPKGPAREKREMPFEASRRHQYWTADVRYLDGLELGGRAYVVSVLDNHSRAILASAVSRTQDLASFLSVLYAAVERYGAPEALVTDSGGVFWARQAKAVYEALGVTKQEIERGRPWQSYIETAFNVQRRMADWHFARRELAGARGGPRPLRRGLQRPGPLRAPGPAVRPAGAGGGARLRHRRAPPACATGVRHRRAPPGGGA